MTRLLVATTNAGKLAEIAPIVAEMGYEACDLSGFPDVTEAVEDGDTFADNAEKKALHYARAAELAVLADDSGLEVTALDGRPGVRSARFAGEGASDGDNNALLLEHMTGVDDRRARFVCSLCLVEDGAVSLRAEGRCEGTLLTAPRGSGGFGYDPLFVPDDPAAGGRTFAELTRDAKRELSHRGRALIELRRALSSRADP